MQAGEISRRLFLKGSGSLAGATVLRGLLPGIAAAAQAACSARDAGEPYKVLTAAEAEALDAITARIVPTTATPGAREAGVVRFIDNAMDGFMAGQLGYLRDGLAGFLEPLDGEFSALPEDEQDGYLAARDETPFFGFVSMLTLFGMFSMPSYGGNRDHAGTRLVGLTPGQHSHAPPFGYYDARYREEQGHDD